MNSWWQISLLSVFNVDDLWARYAWSVFAAADWMTSVRLPLLRFYYWCRDRRRLTCKVLDLMGALSSRNCAGSHRNNQPNRQVWLQKVQEGDICEAVFPGRGGIEGCGMKQRGHDEECGGGPGCTLHRTKVSRRTHARPSPYLPPYRNSEPAPAPLMRSYELHTEYFLWALNNLLIIPLAKKWQESFGLLELIWDNEHFESRL